MSDSCLCCSHLYSAHFHGSDSLCLEKRETDSQETRSVITSTLGAFSVSGMNFGDILASRINSGVLFALLSGFLYAVYLFLKRTERYGYTPFQILSNTFLFSMPWLLLLGALLPGFTQPSLSSFSYVTLYQALLLILLQRSARCYLMHH